LGVDAETGQWLGATARAMQGPPASQSGAHAVDAAGLMPNAAGSFSRDERLAFAGRDILDVTADSAMGV